MLSGEFTSNLTDVPNSQRKILKVIKRLQSAEKNKKQNNYGVLELRAAEVNKIQQLSLCFHCNVRANYRWNYNMVEICLTENWPHTGPKVNYTFNKCS